MEDVEFLRKICEAYAPSSREHWLYPIINDNFKKFGDVSISHLNNIYIHKKGNNKGKIMIMAHADEVFLMIKNIDEKGFLAFKTIGIDPKTLPSQEVIIHGKKNILGIINSKPKEFIGKDEVTNTEMLFIDTGYDLEYIKKYVNIGDYVTIKRKTSLLLNNNLAGKSMDDRAGITAMYICALELERIKHDMDIYFVCSCQEEVGHRGAKMASYEIKPDIGIAIDVTFDSGKMGDLDRENKLGNGPVICIGPNIHPKLRKHIMNIAEVYNIPYQVEVEPGNTGTDAWDIQISGNGIPCLLISIPIKYMHTSVEIVNIDDIRNTARILAKFIEKLKHSELEGLLCF